MRVHVCGQMRGSMLSSLFFFYLKNYVFGFKIATQFRVFFFLMVSVPVPRGRVFFVLCISLPHSRYQRNRQRVSEIYNLIERHKADIHDRIAHAHAATGEDADD